MVAENILNRQFAVAAPNHAWVADITYLWTLEGWVYIAAVVNLFCRRIVGWAIEAICVSRWFIEHYTWP